MTNRAVIVSREAYLKSEFGETIARKWFGDDVVEGLPTYVKGKNKGKFKGAVRWKKVEKGGWVNTGMGDGYVENRVGKVVEKTLFRLDSNGFLNENDFVKTVTS